MSLRRAGRLAGLLLLVAPLAVMAAEDGTLQRLLTLEEARPWAAVGRVNVAGRSFCTGALIAPDKVLTAAHCLYFSRSGKPVPASDLHFLAGWRKGSFLAHRRVKGYAVHPDYTPQNVARASEVSADIAVLQLDSPIGANAALPFQRAERARRGDPVALVSYAKERSEVPSIQEPCHVLERDEALLLLSCDVNFGASGAPVFVMTDEGPKVAALISAMTDQDGARRAVAVDLTGRLDEVLALLTVPTKFRRAPAEGTPLFPDRAPQTDTTRPDKTIRPPGP